MTKPGIAIVILEEHLLYGRQRLRIGAAASRGRLAVHFPMADFAQAERREKSHARLVIAQELDEIRKRFAGETPALPGIADGFGGLSPDFRIFIREKLVQHVRGRLELRLGYRLFKLRTDLTEP